MNLIYFSWLFTQFALYFFIFWRMSVTNTEEWKHTKYIQGSLIGAIIGFIIGGLTGYTLYRINGLWLGMSWGLLLGILAFILNLFLFNKRMKQIREWKTKIIKHTFSKSK